jgi:hypothetical protein
VSQLPSKARLKKILLAQNDTFNCGPIAMYNLLRLSGAKIFKRNLSDLKIILDVNRRTQGTSNPYLYTVAGWAFGKKCKFCCEKVTLKKIDKLLKTGPIILGYVYKDVFFTGHVATILEKKSNSSYLVNNWYRGKKLSIIDKKTMKDALAESRIFQKINKSPLVYPHLHYIEGDAW